MVVVISVLVTHRIYDKRVDVELVEKSISFLPNHHIVSCLDHDPAARGLLAAVVLPDADDYCCYCYFCSGHCVHTNVVVGMLGKIL